MNRENQENGHMFIQEDITTLGSEGQVPGVQNNMPLQNQMVSSTTGLSSSTEKIICARCGAYMKRDARYCMKCGNLNYNHQDNSLMKQKMIDNIKQNGTVGNMETVSADGIVIPEEVLKAPFKHCLITNLIIFIILPLVLNILVYMLFSKSEFEITVNFNFFIVFGIFMLINFFFAYTYQRILIKAGKKWWSFFIPFYNMYVFFDAALGSGWYFLLSFVPIVGLVVSLMATYKLAKRFNKSGWLMLFFPYIMIPVIAFSKNAFYTQEQEISLTKHKVEVSLDGSKKSKVEKRYRVKQFFFSVIVLIGFFLFLYLARDYIKMAYEYFLEQLEIVKNLLIN